MRKDVVAMLKVSEIKKLYDKKLIDKTFVRDLAFCGFITPATYEEITNCKVRSE